MRAYRCQLRDASLEMTVRGSPPEGSRAQYFFTARLLDLVSLRRGLLDLAVAATAGDHQRGAADADRAGRGDQHAEDVRGGGGGPAGHRGGGPATGTARPGALTAT